MKCYEAQFSIIRFNCLILSYLFYHFMSQRLENLAPILAAGKKSALDKSRSRVGFSVKQLRDTLFGKNNFQTYMKPTLDFIEGNKHIFTHHYLQGHSLQEQRKQAVRMMLALRNFWKLDLNQDPLKLLFLQNTLGMFDNGLVITCLVHYFLYSQSLLVYQSNDYHKELIKKSMGTEHFGCFCLTEVSHGSNVAEINTTATYDREKDEFCLSTHGKRGMKFWISNLSHISNVAVVWAQLIIDGKTKGPHPFFLEIRCTKTHKVLPKITIGDCGPKRGMNYVDNGYMILEDVRIPCRNLLGKYGRVENGVYSSSIQGNKARFGIQMSVLSLNRALISFASNSLSFGALAIALRYSFSRKQFDSYDKTDQIPIAQYPLTQNRLFPHIASHIVQIPAGLFISSVYTDLSLFKDQEYLSQMHAISSAAKARYTWINQKAVQDCRTILGGHGYSVFSRIPSINDDMDINVTGEGNNILLLQQVSKYLIKTVPKKPKGKVLDLSFINSKKEIQFDTLEQKICQLETIQQIMEDLLRNRYHSAVQNISDLAKRYTSNQLAELYFHSETGNSLALSFADYFTFTVMKKKIHSVESQQLKDFLLDCVRLWSFNVLQKQRYGPQQFRFVLQRQITIISSSLMDRFVVATDALAGSSFIIGSPFADPQGQGFKDYINLLFSRKQAFSRANYLGDIKKALLQ